MTKFFNEKGKLNFDLMDLYFDKNGIEYDSHNSRYEGVINGKPVHIFHDYNQIFISYDGTDDIEIFYFYEDGSDRLLSHYFMSNTAETIAEISNSNIEMKDGKYSLSSGAAKWSSVPLDNPDADAMILDDDNFPGGSFGDITTKDILGHDLFEIDDTFTTKYGLINLDMEGQQDIISDKPISLEFMLACEGLLDIGYSKVTRNTNVR